MKEESLTTSPVPIEIFQEESIIAEVQPPPPRITLGDYAMQ